MSAQLISLWLISIWEILWNSNFLNSSKNGESRLNKTRNIMNKQKSHSEKKITLVEKLRGRKNDGRAVFYNKKWVFDHKFRLNNHPQNQLHFEEISYTQSTVNPLSSLLVIGTTCGRLNILDTARFENPKISARVNISPTEERNICVLNLEWIRDYFHSLIRIYKSSFLIG